MTVKLLLCPPFDFRIYHDRILKHYRLALVFVDVIYGYQFPEADVLIIGIGIPWIVGFSIVLRIAK